IAGGDGASASRGRNKSGQPTPRALHPIEDLINDTAGDVVMPDRIAEFFELVEDNAIRPRAPDLPALVINFLDIGFPPRRGNDLRADRFEPFEALARHLLGENRNRGASQ